MDTAISIISIAFSLMALGVVIAVVLPLIAGFSYMIAAIVLSCTKEGRKMLKEDLTSITKTIR